MAHPNAANDSPSVVVGIDNRSSGDSVGTPQLTARMAAQPSFKPRSLSPITSAHLDLIRAFAAWAVMWDHSRARFFVSYEQLGGRRPALSLLYFITGFGHEAVILFFVLSGFLISSSVFFKQASGTWTWREYGIDRLSRLWVVLLPGLVLGFLLDEVGRHLFVNTGIYSNALEESGAVVTHSRLGVGVFFGNLFFLQGILCPQFGSNVPLWSLANEFWYYLLFPLGMTAWIAMRRRAARAFGINVVVFIAIAIFVGKTIVASFSIWLMGPVLVFAYSKWHLQRRTWVTLYAIASGFALCVWFIMTRTRHLNDLHADLVTGPLFAAFLFGVLQIDFGARNHFYEHLAHLLAGFSYSLYVLHFPLLLFLGAKFVPADKWQPDSIHVAYWWILGVGVLGYSWFISIFTEGRTKAVRNWAHGVLQAIHGRA